MTETPAATPPLPPAGGPPPAAPAPRGSLGLGVVIAWACLIGGYFAVGLFIGAISGLITGGSNFGTLIAVLAGVMPWVAMLVLAIRFAQQGKPRTALGIGVGFASILGVLLLLVAACFGILSTTNFH